MLHSVTNTPIARKQHDCELCHSAILPGERYASQRYFGSGEAWTIKLCPPCDEVLDESYDELTPEVDGLVHFDQIREWAIDHAGLYDSAAGLYERIRTNA